MIGSLLRSTVMDMKLKASTAFLLLLFFTFPCVDQSPRTLGWCSRVSHQHHGHSWACVIVGDEQRMNGGLTEGGPEETAPIVLDGSPSEGVLHLRGSKQASRYCLMERRVASLSNFPLQSSHVLPLGVSLGILMLQEERMNSTAHDQDSGKTMETQEAGVGHHTELDWAESEGVLKGLQDLP